MKKSFSEWVKLKEIAAPNAQVAPNPIAKKDDKQRVKKDIKNALASTIGQNSTMKSQALKNLAKKTAMNPNASPEDLLDIGDVADKLPKDLKK